MPDAMIVSLQPDAVEAGAEVLRAGGNAVDAALACAFVQTVVDPLMCGVAGFGSMQLYLPDQGVHEIVDFHGRVPAAATPDMWQDRIVGETDDGFGFVLEGAVNDLGYQSITTPGTLEALGKVHERHASLSWQDVIAPAIRIAREGFVVTPGVHGYWTRSADNVPGRVKVSERLAFSEYGRRIYCDERGEPLSVGQTVENPDLADTYGQVAAGGTDVFYRGDIADRIDADMRAKGGLLRKQDLTACRADTTAPLWGRYRGLDVATNRPPGGGVMLIEMLNMLECFDLRAMSHNSPEYIRTLVEVMKIATSDKDHYVGDPRFVDVPLDRLIDKGYAAEQAAFISEGGRRHVERLGLPESPGTTHLCVVDKQGAIVTMTHSLGMMSGVITPGLGFMYNGCMAVFDPRPGRTGSIEPGKSRFSSMCPTTIFDRGRPLIALGAPGGTQIAMGVLQAIVNFVDFGMTPQEAVLAPRFSATSDTVLVTARIPRYRYRELESAGYRFNRSPYSYQIASVHAIGFDENGEPSGAADISYGDGMALRVD